MKEQQKKCIVIAGGGTGGHVIPAMAIAKALQKQDSSVEIHFVGTQKGIEKKLVPKNNFPLHFLRVSGLKNSSLLQKLKALILIPLSFLQSMALIQKLNPQVVVGVGGYASGPFLLMSAIFGRKTFIWEPNAHPGLTNRLLSRFVDTAFVVYDDTNKFFKTKNLIPSGMPIREGITPHARAPHSALRVLVFGGSQGARGINMTVSEAISQGGEWLNNVEIVHQTGELDFDTVMKRYHEKVKNTSVYRFLDDMELRYAWADLVICRSGASTVAELAAAKKAAVLIPFPFASDNHQQKNAESLVAKNAAIMVVQKDFTPDKFVQLITEFKNNFEKIQKLEQNIAHFHRPNAADKIASELLKGIQ